MQDARIMASGSCVASLLVRRTVYTHQVRIMDRQERPGATLCRFTAPIRRQLGHLTEHFLVALVSSPRANQARTLAAGALQATHGFHPEDDSAQVPLQLGRHATRQPPPLHCLWLRWWQSLPLTPGSCKHQCNGMTKSTTYKLVKRKD